MHLLHNGQPDFRRIAAVQTIQTVVMLVAYPYHTGILRRDATEPDIGIGGSGTGLAAGFYTVKLNAVGGTVCGNVLQTIEHIIIRADIGKALSVLGYSPLWCCLRCPSPWCRCGYRRKHRH